MKVYLLVLVLVIVGNLFAQDHAKEENAWRRLLADYPAQPGSIEMNTCFRFPDETDSIYLKAPTSICMDGEGSFYVSDALLNSICIFDRNGKNGYRIGRKGQGPGEFSNIRAIALDKQRNIVVYDDGNHRIQIVDREGRYIKSFKLFRTYYDMVVDRRGRIFLAVMPMQNYAKLIDVFNAEGKLLYSFGFPYKMDTFIMNTVNNVKLCITSRDELIVANVFFNAVRRFNLDGKLLASYRFNYLLAERADKNNEEVIAKNIREPNGGIRLKNVFPSVSPFNEHFYLMHFNPRLEFLEIGNKGEILQVFWANQEHDSIFGDFTVLKNKTGKIDIVCINRFPFFSIEVFSNPEKK